MSGSGHAQRSFGAATATALLVGAAISVALGVYGRVHTPTGRDITSFGFGSLIQMKVWLALAAGALALLQLVTALWMYGKLGSRIPRRIGLIHRSIGALALLITVPVAFHCLWSLGFQDYSTRVLVHSLLGCLVYGVFVTKVLGLNSKRTPTWLVPVAGGVLFTVLVAVVLTSAGWYLSVNGLPTSGTY